MFKKVITTSDLDSKGKLKPEKNLAYIKRVASAEDLADLRRILEERVQERKDNEQIFLRCDQCGHVLISGTSKNLNSECIRCSTGFATSKYGKYRRMKKSEIEEYQKEARAEGAQLLKQIEETRKANEREFQQRVARGDFK